MKLCYDYNSLKEDIDSLEKGDIDGSDLVGCGCWGNVTQDWFTMYKYIQELEEKNRNLRDKLRIVCDGIIGDLV